MISLSLMIRLISCTISELTHTDIKHQPTGNTTR